MKLKILERRPNFCVGNLEDRKFVLTLSDLQQTKRLGIEKAETHNEQANNIQIRINPDQFPFISTLSKFHQKSFNVDSMQIIRVFVKSFYDAKIRFPSNFHQKCFNVDSMQNHLCFLKNVLRRKNKICFPTSQTTS